MDMINKLQEVEANALKDHGYDKARSDSRSVHWSMINIIKKELLTMFLPVGYPHSVFVSL